MYQDEHVTPPPNARWGEQDPLGHQQAFKATLSMSNDKLLSATSKPNSLNHSLMSPEIIKAIKPI